jgi:signal transduction histidine kinase
VRVEYREDELGIEVVDRGEGGGADAKSPDAGFGLAGMRERVALLHGHLSAGPRPGGGFRIAARLPVPAAAEAGFAAAAGAR